MIGEGLWPSSKIVAAAGASVKESRVKKSGKFRIVLSPSTDHPDHSPTSHLTSSRLPRRNVERAHCSAFVPQQYFPPGLLHPLSNAQGTSSSWPHAACHLPPIRRPSSLAPQDATGCLNRNTIAVAYIPCYLPRIYHPLPTQTSSETDTTCERPRRLAILATHSRPDPSVDKSIGQASRMH